MAQVGVVTDSACDIPSDLAKRLGIKVIPLCLIIDGETYLDGISLTSVNDERKKLTRDEFLAKLSQGCKITTSQPSLGVFEGVYKEKETDILSIHISSDLSRTCSTALVAAEEVMRERPRLKIEVIDSWSLGLGQGTLAIKAAEMASTGENIESIVKRTKDLRPKIELWGVLGTLDFAKKGGRIGILPALLGSILKIKPVIKMEEGRPCLVARPRTKKKAIGEMIERFTQEIKKEELVHAGVVHVAAENEALEVVEIIKKHYPGSEITCIETSMVLAVHFGPGLVGIWGLRRG